MVKPAGPDPVKAPSVPDQFLGELAPSEAAKVLAAVADVALLLDQEGMVLDLAVGSAELDDEGLERWVGNPWVDSASPDTKPKLVALLRDAFTNGRTRWRQINHPVSGGADLPVQYTVLRLERKGRALALGRDLRAISSMQQRLVNAQQLIEREYRDLRHSDLRYRMLFQMANEAVVIIDLSSRRVLEANPAAVDLLTRAGARLAGRMFPVGFTEASSKEVTAMLQRLSAGTKVQDIRAWIETGNVECIISASLFRQDRSAMGLVRVRPVDVTPGMMVVPTAQLSMLSATEALPDAVVVTESDGTIISANSAFLEMSQLPSVDHAVGEAIDRWLGRPGVDTAVLMVNLAERGAVNLFSTILRSDFGTVRSVEVSAIVLPESGPQRFAFTIRDVGLRLSDSGAKTNLAKSSVENLTELVGRVPLKEIVRETSDLIERMCIETALELTNDNRASAAEMLGLSRQSLYVKMRRFNIGDLEPLDD